MAVVEPERELVRRAMPFALPATALAFMVGVVVSGRAAGASAGIGVAIVFANFAVHGLSLAWAARISLTALFAVGLGGFLARLGTIVAVMFALNQLSWFSQVAFAAAVIPGTVALLAFEIKQLSGRIQADLWTFERGGVPR